MSFCAACGRQRNGTARYCDGCGAEFTDPQASAAEAADHAAGQRTPPSDVTRFDQPADAARADTIPGTGRTGAPGGGTDPFASWLRPEAAGAAAGAPGEAGSVWQPTQTVLPAQAGGYQPPASAPPGPFPPPGQYPPPASFPPPDRQSGGGRKGLFIVLAAAVVLAAGGGAYALTTTLGRHSAAQPPAPTGQATTPPATQPSSPETGRSASASPSASPSPTPSPSLSLVAVAPGVSSAAMPQVEVVLSRHFQGINTHSYPEYASSLTPREQANQTQSNFQSGYATTTDSGMTLTSLAGTGSGLTATVRFTSRQNPADSVDHSACNTWTLTLYLVPSGTGYLIDTSPSGAPKPVYADC